MTITRVCTSAFFKSSCSFSILAFVLCGAGAANAGALPGHGHFVAGQGAISKSHGVLTIDQNTQTGIINWKTFSIGKKNSVEFDNAGRATLNRVTGGNMSRIAGALHGAGSVYLINNSGVAVLPTGRIVTQGSFAASGRNADTDAFSGKKRLLFTGGAHGDVINAGSITSTNGRVDLNGRNVLSSGSVSARNASVLASETTRVSGRIDAHAIQGRGGNIETSGVRVRVGGAHIAGASWLVDPKNLKVNAPAAATISSSLNHGTNVTLKTTATGTSGPGVASDGPGDITVIAPIAWAGTATLTLNAYHSVQVDDLIHAKGKGGLTIDTAHDGDLMFANGGRVQFDSLASDLNIDGASFTLENNLAALTSAITAKPNGNYAMANNYNAAANGTYTSSVIHKAFQGTLEGLGNVINNLTIKNAAGDDTGLFSTVGANGAVRDINLANAEIYGLANNAYVGGLVANNKGRISGASISGKVRGGYESFAGGLVGYAAGSSRISGSSSAAQVSGSYYSYAGGLVGTNEGTISGSTASGDVTSGYDSYVGGLVGHNDGGDVDGSSASGDVTGDYQADVGGLIGYDESGTVTNSRASGDVFGGYHSYAGGLIGGNYESALSKSSATGDVTADYESYVGGLFGYDEYGKVLSSHASGAVNAGYDSYAGGLSGYAFDEIAKNVFATGDVTADVSYAGGLFGYTGDATLTNTHASGNVAGGSGSEIGGLIGYEDAVTPLTDSYATGNVSGGSGSQAGGLVGVIVDNASPIVNSYATGNVSGGKSSYSGGLVGNNEGGSSITGAHASGHVTGGYESYVGGLAGYSTQGTIENSYATGNVESGYEYYAGGLVGYDYEGTILNSHATGAVNGGTETLTGGLVGYADLDTINKSYATGNVSGGYEDYVGGLVGETTAGTTIKSSYASGRATGEDYGYAGGLVGANYGTVLESYAAGEVVGGYDGYDGGLVGYNGSGGVINKSFATGDVSANDSYVGGLVGENEAAIEHAYARGDVTASGSYAGGLVGYNTSTGTIDQTYSTGYVVNSLIADTGGLVGYDDAAAGNITASYWDKQTSGISDTARGAGNVAHDSGIAAKTTAQLKALPAGLTSTYWKVNASANDGLPFLIGNAPN
ncbi:MAG TPA: GLUG motif-containing protein [Rhizomicrobium sp.]|nr:GLUG motif-containing protein [Rhizomicrobium sp.]